LQKIAVYTIAIFIIFAIGVSAQASFIFTPKDSLIYKDTLIGSRTIHQRRPVRFGVGGNYGINYYRDGALPSLLSPLCDTFTTGRGSGLNFLARIDFPIVSENSGLSFSPIVSYENFGADHTWGEFGPSTDTSGGKRTDRQIHFDHIITNTTKAIGLKALLGWQFIKPFSFEAGPAFYYLFDQNYTKTEKAINPGYVITTP
jgi:hypothetical protein